MSSTGKRLLGLMVILSVSAILVLRPGGNKALIAESADVVSQASVSGHPLLSGMKNVQTSEASEPQRQEVVITEINQPQPEVKPRASWPETRTIRMRVTAYCPCRKCCGKFSDGVTASGKSVYTNNSMFVAADTSLLPFGTMVSIPGYYGGLPVPVLDRGRVIKNKRIDLFYMSHQRARKWGSKWVDVKVYLPDK